MAGLTLLLGGVRAGKSAKALALASASDRGRGVLFVATAQPFDEEMARRIAKEPYRLHGRDPDAWRLRSRRLSAILVQQANAPCLPHVLPAPRRQHLL